MLQLRQAVPTDGEAVASLVLQFRNFLGRVEPSDADLRLSVDHWLLCSDTDVLLATLGVEPIGYVTTLYQHSLWANGLAATISDLFVVDAHRKTGAGRRLVKHALELASARGARSAGLSTNEKNTASTRIYESLGFSSVSALWQGRQVFYRKSLVRT